MSPTAVHASRLTGTPVGTVRVWGTEHGLRRVDFSGGRDVPAPDERLAPGPAPAVIERALEDLGRYFAGDRPDLLDLPRDPGPLTPFRARVYEALLEVGPGRVTTYGEIADRLGMPPGSARAVGQAVGANPLAVVIPCHRVLASDGTLHGYGGGLGRKATLLRLEGLEVEGELPDSRVHPARLRLGL